MEDKTLKLTNPTLPTITLPTGETVLAGRDRKSDPLRPMKYGNETQASTKLDSIKEGLRAEGKSGAVVRQGNRFLIFVYENEPVVVGREPQHLSYPERPPAKTAAEFGMAYGTNPSVVLFDFEGPDWTNPTSRPDVAPTSSNLLAQMDNTPNMGPDQVVYVGADLGNTPAEDFDQMMRPFKPDLVDLETGNLYDLKTTSDPEEETRVRAINRERVRKALRRAGNEATSRNGKIFATVSGPRINPRNRHNQHHEDGDGKELHRFVSDPNKPRVRESVQASDYWNEKRRREALKYKLTGGFNDERKG